jgi:hypothetical protein
LFRPQRSTSLGLFLCHSPEQNRPLNERPSAGALSLIARKYDFGRRENPIDNPIGLFSYLAASHGFQDRQTAMHALREFSKVEGQSWAKELLRRSGELDEDDEGE